MSDGIPGVFMEERPITVDEACALRMLLFGNIKDSFSFGWTQQGFRFKCYPPYSFLQKRSGPCGVLAAVQAFVIHELIFGYSRVVLDDGHLRPDDAERKEALARALASILWRAGRKKTAVLAKIYDRIVLNDSITSSILEGDGFLEYVRLKYFRTRDSLLQHLYNYIQELIKDGGCILFVYSIILTHGIDKIKEEMDSPECHLIGSDEYCSQEVVNLILIGRAVSNVFDGNVELTDEGSEDRIVLKGIPSQSKIGFLSISEYMDNYSVGSFYKDPEYPIWVVFGINHFTVLFGTSKNIFREEDKISLFHIDCLERNNSDETYLKLEPKAMEEFKKDYTLPVLKKCIQTRWPLADMSSHSVPKKG